MENKQWIKKDKLVICLDMDKERLKKEIVQLKQIRELILKSPTYLLLDGKTQIAEQRESKELARVRSRMEHATNVSFIAKGIMQKIYEKMKPEQIEEEIYELNKEKEIRYTEIMGLSHDLGHTPFGHAGEIVLNEFIGSITDYEEINTIIQHRRECFGEEYEEEQGHIEDFNGRLSFEHNEQSALEFKRMVQQSNMVIGEVDLQRIIDGILAHSISRVPNVPKDLAAQIVRQTDKIEYRNLDFDEMAELVEFKDDIEEVKAYKMLSYKQRIKKNMTAIVKEAIQKGEIVDDNEPMKITKQMRKQYENVLYYLEEDGTRGLLTQNYRERNQTMYQKILNYYYQHPEKIPTKAMLYNNPIDNTKMSNRVVAYNSENTIHQTQVEQVIQYVNTFTNKKCEDQYLRLVRERITKGHEFGIEPITSKDIQARKYNQIEEAIGKVRARDIYKSSRARSDQEIWQIIGKTNREFIERQVTPKGKEKIGQIKKLIQEKDRQDKLLNQEMELADRARKIARITRENRTSKFKNVKQGQEKEIGRSVKEKYGQSDIVR